MYVLVNAANTKQLLTFCVQFMASWIAIFTIEKFGRRSLMMFGAAGMSISMAVLAGTTSIEGNAAFGIAAVSHTVLLHVGMTWLHYFASARGIRYRSLKSPLLPTTMTFCIPTMY
jgi:hypothetical protein